MLPPPPPSRGVLLLPFALLVFVLLRWRGARHAAGVTLLSPDVLTYEQSALLGLSSTAAAVAAHSWPSSRDNPWRTARGGCGGRVRPAARAGALVAMRYILRDAAGDVMDSTANRSVVEMRMGSGHDVALGGVHMLSGLCAGDVALATLPTGGSALIYVVRVGMPRALDAHLRLNALAAATVATPAHRRHLPCKAVCRRRGMRCVAAAFAVINDCDRMQAAMPCRACEMAPAGAAGADMPCLVADTAPHPFRAGLCLVAPHPSLSRCEAAHLHTIRLCPCVDEEFVEKHAAAFGVA